MEVNAKSTLPVAVIGAGAAGLAAAHALARAGRPARLLEASSRVGGVIQSEVFPEGWQTESGPHTLLLKDSEVRDLIAHLGLTADIVTASPEAKHRYLVRDGKPVPAPASPPSLLGTPLFTAGTKLRLLTEFFTRPRTRPQDVSLATLIGDHFGAEVVDYALQPFVSGVCAGDASRLSAQHAFPRLWQDERNCGSLLRAQIRGARERRRRGEPRPQIVSFSRGLQTLVDALRGSLPEGFLSLNTRVEAAAPDGAFWRLSGRREGQPFSETFSDLILALPAPALETLAVGNPPERPFALLAGLEHPPVSVISLGYRREDVSHPLDGFGLLMPPCEKRRILGVVFTSSLFPTRAPAGHVGFTVMIGGSLQPQFGTLPPDQALALVESELQPLLGVTGKPVFHRHHTHSKAIPQYNLGFERFVNAITSAEQRFPGLHVAGQVRDGISVPAALLSGLRTARKCLEGHGPS